MKSNKKDQKEKKKKRNKKEMEVDIRAQRPLRSLEEGLELARESRTFFLP